MRFMPRDVDHTSMWWRDGFPDVVEGAPWHRCVKTGSYGFILDTESLEVPHLGAVGESLAALPGAELALQISANGKNYLCRGAEEWTRFTGPRLIESGRFLQRADVTDLVFMADSGERLNVEARFETLAWSDQLGLILAARPGVQAIVSGEDSFGRVRGGFGLSGENHFDVPADQFQDAPNFTLAFWAFVPSDFRAGKNNPWLVCKNPHEQADGNFGIMLDQDAVPEARFNVGGGRENAAIAKAGRQHKLKLDDWNFLAISYDSEVLRLFVNGQFVVEEKIGKARSPKSGSLAIGDRQDGLGDGAFRFRGVIDEVRWYDYAVALGGLRSLRARPETVPEHLLGSQKWTFRENGKVSLSQSAESWEDAKMELVLTQGGNVIRSVWKSEVGESWKSPDWKEIGIRFDPSRPGSLGSPHRIEIEATERETGNSRPVSFEPLRGWHRINLDGVEPVTPHGQQNPTNDAMERIRLRVKNSSDSEQVARLLFEKTRRGIQQKIGTPITGVSAILRDTDGNPTGIPVQLSKNWHVHPKGGAYSGQWFHGISQLRMPPESELELELCLIYGHWGGVAAASHSQLSLIGWGGNQRWDQAAIGSWGESICFDPEQAQANCSITDVRPLMVTAMKDGKQWGWTNNHGGGDFLRYFDTDGNRRPHSRMRAVYHRQGPCLTEVTYSGKIHGTGIDHDTTVSLSRRDDMTVGTYRIRMRVSEAVDFSRFVIFQIGADTYSSSGERKMAMGNAGGLVREWETQWGGDEYRMDPFSVEGKAAWASLHDTAGGNGHGEQSGAWANRGIVIREWKAKLGGKNALPNFAERGVDLAGNRKASTMDIVPPKGVRRFEPGDFVEAVIEHLIVPKSADDYYGSNEKLGTALQEDGNTWKMIQRQALEDQREVVVTTGKLSRTYPDIRIIAENGSALVAVRGGLGYIPITIGGLSSPAGGSLEINGAILDQSVHGSDFWQTDFDPKTKTWSRTYNVKFRGGAETKVQFSSD